MPTSRTVAALVAIAIATGAFSSPSRAQDVCNNPSFRFPAGGPFTVPAPKPGVRIDLVAALNAGTYVARPELTGCRCDLAVALATSHPSEGFVALMRGNENGTFTLHPGAVLAVDGTPVALASGPLRQDIKTAFDGIVVVTSQFGENGRVHVFVPDANGNYGSPQVLTAGPEPVAVTLGDFNGDGRRDVAVANRGDNSLTILFGTEAGTFGSSVTVPKLPGIPESIAAGRFSGGSGSSDDIAVSVLQDIKGAPQVGIVVISRNSSGSFVRSGDIVPIGRVGSRLSSIAAANLSGPQVGTAGRRFRDLAVGFLDHTPTGDAIGRVQVLLGQDKGGFTIGQTHDFNRIPTSIKIEDLDDDGVVDMIVSTHGTLASQLDGSVHFFKGSAGPGPNAGFHVNQGWNRIPDTTGIRPHNLVAGRFGENRPAQRASMGVAAINAINASHNSVAVFLGNGRGEFVQPKQVTTQLEMDDRLFVVGDFHSTNGDSPLVDIALVTRVKNRNELIVLQSNGDAGFERTLGLTILAGDSPSVMVAGRFTPTGPLGIAIVDATGGPLKQPLLKVFIGEGQGRFKIPFELLLNQAGRPRAIATGQFRGAGMPLDIAIVSETGRLTVLFNDGNGNFTIGRMRDLGFAPGSMVASNRLRPEGQTDLLIRDANSNRFLFLLNIDGGDFRPADNQNEGFFDGAGNVDALLVGNVASGSRAEPLDDVVTYDRDMTLKVFKNVGTELFVLQDAIPPSSTDAQPPYVLADFGSGKLVLAAPVVRDGLIGLALLHGNGEGGFKAATGQVPLRPFGGKRPPKPTVKTDFKTPPLPPTFRRFDFQVRLGLAAQFRSSLHGNNKPDLGFILHGTERSLVSGVCTNDPRPFPKPIPGKPPREVCTKQQLGTFDCKELMQKPPCFETVCETIAGTPDIPFSAFCEAVHPFGLALTVYGNTCAD